MKNYEFIFNDQFYICCIFLSNLVEDVLYMHLDKLHQEGPYISILKSFHVEMFKTLHVQFCLNTVMT